MLLNIMKFEKKLMLIMIMMMFMMVVMMMIKVVVVIMLMKVIVEYRSDDVTKINLLNFKILTMWR